MARIIFILFYISSSLAFSIEGSWTVFNSQNSDIYSDDLRCLAFDEKNGILWIYSDEKMLMYFDGENWGGVNTSPLEKSDYDKPIAMDVDSHGDLWIAWQNVGLVKFDGENAYPYDIGTKYFNNLTIDSEDNKWISASKLMKMSTDNSITIYNESNSSIPPNRSIKAAVVFDSESNMYVATDCGGIAKYSPPDFWELLQAKDVGAFEISRFDCMYGAAIDSEDKLYLGNQTNGLFILCNDQLVAHYGPENSILPEFVDEIFIDSYDNVWVPKWGEGICVFDGYDWELIDSGNSSLPSNNVNSIVKGPNSEVWVSTDNGLACFNPVMVSSRSDKYDENLEVFPNPFSDYITLRNSGSVVDNIDIYDMLGRLVYHGNLTSGSNVIPATGLAIGTYIYRLMNDNIQVQSGVVIKL